MSQTPKESAMSVANSPVRPETPPPVRFGQLALLDYQTIGGSLSQITSTTTITAFAAHNLFIVVGTAAGTVHVLDLPGNELHSWPLHAGPVSALAITTDGEVVISGGVDGKLNLVSLVGDAPVSAAMRAPILSLAVLGETSGVGAVRSRTVFVGLEDGNLVSFSTRALLSSRELVIHRGEGPITALATSGSLLAAATGYGVRIFDVALELRLAFVDRPASTTGASPLALRPTLRWRPHPTEPLLLIAWGDTALVVRVRRAPPKGTAHGKSGRAATIVSRVSLGAQQGMLAAAPLEDELLLLCGPVDRLLDEAGNRGEERKEAGEEEGEEEKDGMSSSDHDDATAPAPTTPAPAAPSTNTVMRYPTVLVVGQDGRELLYEGLDVFEDCKLSELLLVPSPAAAEPRTDVPLTGANSDVLRYLFPPPKEAATLIYYIVSPHTVVAAIRANILQHVESLVLHGRVEEALHTAEADTTRTLTPDHIRALGRRLVLTLLEQGDASRAAAACPRYLGSDVQLWQRFIFIFAQAGRLSALVPYLPTGDVRLPDVAYGSVLAHFLATDHVAFEELISRWPASLFDGRAVVSAVRSRLSTLAEAGVTQGTAPLYRALYTLYDHAGDHAKALQSLLAVADSEQGADSTIIVDVFTYIRRHSLYAAMQDRVDDLLRLDEGAAVDLLAAAPEVLPPHFVVAQIQARVDSGPALYRYLAAVERVAPGRLGADHLDTLVMLTAEYAPELLADLVVRNEGIRLHNARRVCRERGLLAPQIQILQRIGTEAAHRESLEILVAHMHDVDAAVDYVIANDRENLWPLLIKLAATEASFTVTTGGKVDAAATATAHAAFVQALLQQTGSRMHPRHCAALLQQIPPTLELPGLRDSLARVITQCHLQVSMRRSTNALVRADTAGLADAVFAAQKRGCVVRAGAVCGLCSLPLMSEKQLTGSGEDAGTAASAAVGGRAVMFRCGHVYHGHCLAAVSSGKGLQCTHCAGQN